MSIIQILPVNRKSTGKQTRPINVVKPEYKYYTYVCKYTINNYNELQCMTRGFNSDLFSLKMSYTPKITFDNFYFYFICIKLFKTAQYYAKESIWLGFIVKANILCDIKMYFLSECPYNCFCSFAMRFVKKTLVHIYLH